MSSTERTTPNPMICKASPDATGFQGSSSNVVRGSARYSFWLGYPVEPNRKVPVTAKYPKSWPTYPSFCDNCHDFRSFESPGHLKCQVATLTMWSWVVPQKGYSNASPIQAFYGSFQESGALTMRTPTKRTPNL